MVLRWPTEVRNRVKPVAWCNCRAV
uniref:Arc family DNA-binding protein n=1 Tax=Congzhengia minquanensis TaxID=2763657 RepID=A0A926HXN2_9FIRM|nr:Arc family DNA-binding protein [Congzhengia minquanensis]